MLMLMDVMIVLAEAYNINSDGFDYDGDGMCDLGDEDDDNDGAPDQFDSEDNNPNICSDVDADGCDDCTSAEFNSFRWL